MSDKDILILGIESSCDETAAAVVKNGRNILSNVISSQIDIHTLYGGVVPEIASRKHIERINYVIEEALEKAEVKLEDIDAIGVTYGPGLVGALLVGVAEAKAIAYAAGKPLVGVHHIVGDGDGHEHVIFSRIVGHGGRVGHGSAVLRDLVHVGVVAGTATE